MVHHYRTTFPPRASIGEMGMSIRIPVLTLAASTKVDSSRCSDTVDNADFDRASATYGLPAFVLVFTSSIIGRYRHRRGSAYI
jgi:hypothetical protein